jgi:hypothetical protein
MEFSIKKSIERVSQAIYLATNHIKDTEPLKWELRRETLSCLACSQPFEQKEEIMEEPLEIALQAFSASSNDLISLMNVAIAAGLISRANGMLIIREIESVLPALEKDIQEKVSQAGFVLSDDFFRQLDKGQKLNLPLNPTKNASSTEKKDTNPSSEVKNESVNLKDKKDQRIQQIIAVLKNQPQSTIKDFSRIITDCSEKTIQRELTELVEKGIVKKEGERRWSTYSLT